MGRMKAARVTVKKLYTQFSRRLSAVLGGIQVILGAVGVICVILGFATGLRTYIIFLPCLMYIVTGITSLVSSKIPSRLHICLTLAFSIISCLCTIPPVMYVIYQGLNAINSDAAAMFGCHAPSPHQCLIWHADSPGKAVVDRNNTCVWHSNATCLPSPQASTKVTCSLYDLKASCHVLDKLGLFQDQTKQVLTYILIGAGCVEFIVSLILIIACSRSLCCEIPLKAILTKAGKYVPVPERLLSVLSNSSEEGAAEQMLASDRFDIKTVELFIDHDRQNSDRKLTAS